MTMQNENVINIDNGQPVTSEPEATFDPMAHLAKNAVLFSVKVHIPSFSKLDKEASKKYSVSKNAKIGMHKISKTLLDSPKVTELRSLGNKARNALKDSKRTSPYSDGWELVENEGIIDMTNDVLAIFAKMDKLKAELREDHVRLQAKMQMDLGDDYDASQEISIDELDRKLHWDLIPRAVPLTQDFRGELQQELLEELRAKCQDNALYSMREAMRKVMAVLMEKVENVSKQLTDKDLNEEDEMNGKNKCKSFQSTLIDNVLLQVDKLDVCNIYNDVGISNLQEALRNSLQGITVEQLKASDTLREKTKEEVDAIINNIPTLI